ncbi:putative DNA binding protein [Haloarcula quadrata]|uniref:Putative DNA binding protein n=2 Tax=Haloarcula quadrata TaxID=182779 RepID=A0A495QQG9_9EURY|nr:putative DNA binding protein [Haloarcula quadrata]
MSRQYSYCYMSTAPPEMGTHLTLDLWHPECWAIQATEELPGGVLAHAIYDTIGGGSAKTSGIFTAYGESESEVTDLLAHIESSSLTGELREVETRFDTQRVASGTVSYEFFLEYDPNDMICPQLLEHGFVHNAPGRIEDGRESWHVCYAGERSEITSELDSIRERTEAEIDIARISSGGQEDRRSQLLNTLTPKQRNAFKLAQERGYYEWPREVSTRELADEFGVAKTTFLGHLRRAESVLLDF